MPRKRKPERRAPGSGYLTTLASGKVKAHFPKADGRGYHVRTFRDRTEAARWLDGLTADAAAHYDVSGGRTPFRAWVDSWLQARAAEDPPPKATTLADYAFKLGYPVDLMGDTPIGDLLPDHIDAAMTKIQKRLAATTARQIRNLLRQVFAEAIRRRYISHNPADAPKRRRAPERKAPHRLSADQAARLLVAAAGRPDELAWWLILTLGLRAGEVCGLRCGDIDLAAGVLTITQQVTTLGGKRHISTPKSDHSARALPIPRAILPALRARCATRAADAYLFAGRDGGALHPTSLLHMLRHKRVKDKPAEGLYVTAKLPETITVHHLRHTAGQLYADAGASEHYIAAILGHSATTITRHYAPPSLSALCPFVDAVADRLARTVADVRRAA